MVKHELVQLHPSPDVRSGFEGILGTSPVMASVFKLIDRAAPTPSTVLITGDSGTGKELVARAVHARSAIADKDFVPVNTAAIPAEVVEAQLFGHEKGAYTSADRRREGLLRGAHAGTVFLDEIGDLPMATQVKLLRAIESHEVLPVGADRPQRVDFRLIAATNQDLELAVREGRFRADLFYRLNVVRVRLPPLRDRRDDIPDLAEHFLALHGKVIRKAPQAISSEAMRALLAYAWPGNVRELSNVIERAAIVAGGPVIEVSDLPGEFHGADRAPTALRQAVEDFEQRHIAWVLRLSGGNREQAARTLGIDPATLYRRLAKYQT